MRDERVATAGRSPRRPRAVWAVAVAAAAVAAWLLVRAVTPSLGGGDRLVYRAMAEHQRRFTQAPFGYRVLVPTAVHGAMRIGGLDAQPAYGLVNAALFAAFWCAFAAWAVRFERIPRATTALVLGLYALSYPAVYYAHNVMHVGPGEQLVLLLGLIAIRRGSFAGLAAAVFVGQFARETTAALAPVWLAARIGRVPARTWWREAALLAAAFAAPFVVLRSGLWFDAATAAEAACQAGAVTARSERVAAWGGPYNVVMRIVDAFGGLWALAAAGVFFAAPLERRLALLAPLLLAPFAAPLERRLALLAPLLLAPIAVATDVTRMAAAAPVVLFFGAKFLSALPPRAQAGLAVALAADLWLFAQGSPWTRWSRLASWLLVAAFAARRFRAGRAAAAPRSMPSGAAGA